jgi:hypothetical protein
MRVMGDWRVGMWHRVLVVALVLGVGVLVAAPRAIAQPATPCPAATPVVTGDTYDPNRPIGMGGAGNLSATIDVPGAAADRYLGFAVAYVGDGRFAVTLTAPSGDQHEVFTAIHPGNGTIAVAAAEAGTYTVTVEADGPWTVIIQ